MAETIQTTSEPPRLAVRRPEAAAMLGISPRLLWTLTNQGSIPHVRMGSAIVYPVAELRAWLSEQAAIKGHRR